jgi:radical SAM protein with 4Fe4S-binding SPASM domain
VHEVEIARKYFSNIGITFLLKGINLNIHRRNDGKEHQDLAHWIAIGHQYSKYEKDKDGNIVQKAGFKDKCDTCLKPVITCNGDILLCCHDIFKSINLGNINDTYDLKEFWLSEKYKNIRRMATERELPLCKKCGV